MSCQTTHPGGERFSSGTLARPPRFSIWVNRPTALRMDPVYSRASSALSTLLYITSTALLASLNWAIYSRLKLVTEFQEYLHLISPHACYRVCKVALRSASTLPFGVRNHKKERKRQERNMALILTSVVLIFLICQAPR